MDLSLEALRDLPVWQAALLGAGGLAVGLAGYRLMLLFDNIFLGGLFALVGLAIGAGTEIPWIGILLAAVLGVAGYVLGVVYFRLKFVAIGVVGGGALGWTAAEMLGHPGNPWFALGGATALGVAGFTFVRPIVILSTAVAGAAASTAAAMVSLNSMGILPVEKYGWVYLGLIVLLGIGFAAVQARTTDPTGDQLRRLMDARRSRLER